MSRLTLRFKKRNDGSAALTLVRADGSWTGSTIGAAEGYGPVHDLAHYAVESCLGLTGGFLGLVARGWDIEDFEVRALERIGREPDGQDAGVAEALAGALSGGAVSGQRLVASATEFNATISEEYRDWTGPPPRAVTDEDLHAMRETLSALRRHWDSLPPGETLELRFTPGQAVRYPASFGETPSIEASKA